MPTILYILLGFLLLLIILYFILRRTPSNSDQRVDIETVRVSEIKIDSKSESVIKLDLEKFNDDQKKSYDEMVGRL